MKIDEKTYNEKINEITDLIVKYIELRCNNKEISKGIRHTLIVLSLIEFYTNFILFSELIEEHVNPYIETKKEFKKALKEMKKNYKDLSIVKKHLLRFDDELLNTMKKLVSLIDEKQTNLTDYLDQITEMLHCSQSGISYIPAKVLENKSEYYNKEIDEHIKKLKK